MAIRDAGMNSTLIALQKKQELLNHLQGSKVDVILSEHDLPRLDALGILPQVKILAPLVPFIIVASSSNEVTTVACLQAGAWDYVLKSHLVRLGSIIAKALERRRTQEELKKAEKKLLFFKQQLQHRQKIEAIGRLASGVAHDFNSLLTVILGNCESLLSAMAAKDTKRLDVEEIKRAGTQGVNLTRQLLALARRDSGSPMILDLNTIVTDMRGLLSHLIGVDINIHTQLTPALKHIKAKAGQIEQIILNLAINARDAMPQGGKLIIETANIIKIRQAGGVKSYGHPSSGPHVMLSMSDTGQGLNQDIFSHLFEAFFTTKNLKGTGLGLSIIYEIIQENNGYIEVWSQPKIGTRFKIYLPQAEYVHKRYGNC
jgi:signal transduction histidine kinase